MTKDNKIKYRRFLLFIIISGISLFFIDNTGVEWIKFGELGPEFNAKLVGKPIGAFLILWGSYFLYKLSKTKPIEVVGFKCPACGKVVLLKETHHHSCKACGNKLEKIEGFFERHPNFTDKTKE